jgi:hypothetical protein
MRARGFDRLQGGRSGECCGQCRLELLERKGLDEVRGGSELERFALGWEDAREHDRAPLLADAPREPKARKVAGLDHRGIDLGHGTTVPVVIDGLMPEPVDDMLQKRTDVGMGFDDQDPRHDEIIPVSRRDPAPVRV